jgi:hypothetical protein
MLSKLPRELTYAISYYLHLLDIMALACASIYNRSTYDNIALPCLRLLEPVSKVAQRRRRFERYFGKARDLVFVSTRDDWNPVQAVRLANAQGPSQITLRRSMRHEHAIGFLKLDETLGWLPPLNDEMYSLCGAEDYLTAATEQDKMMIGSVAEQLGLAIPPSFFKFMSDPKLMQRLPYSFWLPAHRSITTAASLVDNRLEGYMIDFCRKQDDDQNTYVWSLWLTPHPRESHCVVGRQLVASVDAMDRKPVARLVGTSFELWLASTFFSHWTDCRKDACCDMHWWLDQPLLSAVREYVQYNCVTARLADNTVGPSTGDFPKTPA